jgi:hypothetical protein
MLAIWFGNFFEPFYSDESAVLRGLSEIASLGFNSINLDSKPWEDFFARYRREAPSRYVAMQELMISEAAALGIDHTHLALYLCGDNLYPTIRDVPPVRGEEAIGVDGRPIGTYKYWSGKAQATMVRHIEGLLALYGTSMRRRSGRIVMQTMFEPIPKPSFDSEGRSRYLAWLSKRYDRDITRLNERYGLRARSFEQLSPDDYWLNPAAVGPVDCGRPSKLDFEERTAAFHKWLDNQTYLADELEIFLSTMKAQWNRLGVFSEPVLHQWGYFFNPPGRPYWQTGLRALDVYRASAHLDGSIFIAAPLNAENEPDATALSAETALMRDANRGRRFTGGLYLGRHVNCDIYRSVTPAEAIGTLVAGGAGGYHIYGYSGLDDGGVLFRMEGGFKESLAAANRWALRVIPLLDEPRAKEVALLFPREMSLYEPLEVDEGGRHRMDLLGWYQQFTDLGWHVDIVHPDAAVEGALASYRHLAIPHNSLYDVDDNSALEAAVRAYVGSGGNVLHGPHCKLIERTFGIQDEEVDFDCIRWRSDIIPHGWSTVAWRSGLALGSYIDSGRMAMAESSFGRGKIWSFGFQYGYAYSRRTTPWVPSRYGRREMHPIVLLEETPVAGLVNASSKTPIAPRRGLEFARFGSRWILVNHRSSPIALGNGVSDHAIFQILSAPGYLAAHSAVCLPTNSDEGLR